MFIPVDDTIVGCGLCQEHASKATEYMSIGFFYVQKSIDFVILTVKKGPIVINIRDKKYDFIFEMHKVQDTDFLYLDLISINEPKGYHTDLNACISPLINLEELA